MSMLIIIDGSVPTPPAVTWNPADKSSNVILSSGDLLATRVGSGNSYATVRATLGRSATDAGGFYFETHIGQGGTSPFIMVGVANASASLSASVGGTANGWAYYQQTGEKYTSNVASAYAASYTTGDVIGILLKNGKLYFRKNGTWLNSADVAAETGAAFTGLTGTLYPAVSVWRGDTPANAVTGRFKSTDFSGGIPSGAAAWE